MIFEDDMRKLKTSSVLSGLTFVKKKNIHNFFEFYFPIQNSSETFRIERPSKNVSFEGLTANSIL